MSKRTLQELLRAAARTSAGLVLYEPGNTNDATFMSYADLFREALSLSAKLLEVQGYHRHDPVLIHCKEHKNTVLWFWAVLLACGTPVLFTLPNGHDDRTKNIRHVSLILGSPICLVDSDSRHIFCHSPGLLIQTMEELAICPVSPQEVNHREQQPYEVLNTPCMMMLTSGSTGSPKIVPLSHDQVITSVIGKARLRESSIKGNPLLNWIQLDHVASIVEIHIQAMWLEVSQVLVHPADIISAPTAFLDLLHRHKVSKSFAPNSFLAKLASDLDKMDSPVPFEGKSWNLENLCFLASGGEANDVQTCVAITNLLAGYGAHRNVLVPGFGMTETCAGSIFNLACPDYDVEHGLDLASVGKCMSGISMRISTDTFDTVKRNSNESQMVQNQVGDLEITGEVVFKGYYQNEAANCKAFTADGWFITGDRAFIDSKGNLQVVGRNKSVLNVNGLKFSPTEVEDALIQGLSGHISRLVCSSCRPREAKTESVLIIYVPIQWPLEDSALLDLHRSIVAKCVQFTGATPLIFALPDNDLLPTTSLGKISRSILQEMYQENKFQNYVDQYNTLITTRISHRPLLPLDDDHRALQRDISHALGVSHDLLSLDTSIFEFGITSIDLIRLKRTIDQRLHADIPITVFMANPTLHSLARTIKDYNPEEHSKTHNYNPLVVLRSEGRKAPLWLVHPGVGEVLVFFGLSKLIQDRPIYALRARGFDGEPLFNSIEEIVSVYHSAIKLRQPSGPYAIAGYSYGSMLAFEIGKAMEKQGDTIAFLGVFNLPPHIRARMRQLTWKACFLHLAYFLELVSEECSGRIEQNLSLLSNKAAVDKVLSIADKNRIAELGLSKTALENWALLAHGLQYMAVDYEPTGSIGNVDVFHAFPLKVAASSREEWLDGQLKKWEDFSRTEPKFHEVGGEHYTMIGPFHVKSFANTLDNALSSRGL